MSTTYDPAQGCPKCSGQSGYEYTMTEEHTTGVNGGELVAAQRPKRRFG